MRLGIVLSLWLSVGCAAFCQGNSPPQFYAYNGPRVAYAQTFIAFSLLAEDFQPESMGGILDFDLLAAPSNTNLTPIRGDRGEQLAFISWQTPPRSAVGTTNRFVIRATDHGFPPLSATNEISFAVLDVPPIHSIFMSNGMPVLQFSNPVPTQHYLVQWADVLPTTNWSPLFPVYSGLPLVTIKDTNPPTSQRFYRVLLYGGWCYGSSCP